MLEEKAVKSYYTFSEDFKQVFFIINIYMGFNSTGGMLPDNLTFTEEAFINKNVVNQLVVACI